MGRACSSAGSDPKAADPGGPSLKQNMADAAVAGRAAAAALLVLQRVRVAHAAAAVRVVVVRAGFVAWAVRAAPPALIQRRSIPVDPA